MSDGFVTVAKAGQIPVGAAQVVRVGDQSLAVFHLADGYHVLDDVCTHDGGPLAEGVLDGDVIECPRHGARFDVRTGAAIQLPAFEPVETHEVRLEGDTVQVGVEHQ